MILAISGLVLGALFAAELASHYEPRKLSAVLVVLFWVPLLVLHEAAHALAARSVGWTVREIVIGFGRELFRFRLGPTRVRVRMLPLEGYVVPEPNDISHARLKSAFIYLAGPLSELLLVLGLWLWQGDVLLADSEEYAHVALKSLALAALLGAGFNLLPYRSGQGVSDGLGVFSSLLSNDRDYALRLSEHAVSQVRHALYREDWQQAQELIDEALQRHSGDERLLGLRAVALAGQGAQAEAITLLESLGHPDEKPAALRHELLLDAAWMVLVSRDTSLLADAQRACERALTSWSDSLRAHLMLGNVLLERGHLEPAQRHLAEAYGSAADQPEEQLLLALLTITARARHDWEHERRYLSALDPSQLGPQLRSRVVDPAPTP
jgi:hypothetical protein